MNLESIQQQIDTRAMSAFQVLNAAVSLTLAEAPRGASVVLLGLSEKMASFQPLKVVREGIQIIPSLIYDHPMDFKRTIQLIASKKILLASSFSDQFRLDKIQEAMNTAASGSKVKIVIDLES